jgi:hypothetical protein
MSDTSAPSAPPPVTPTETPIDTNPQVSPNPISNTPPEVGKIGERGDTARPMSRREAIQAAFDRATRQQDGKEPTKLKTSPEQTKAKPAEAKAGHNKPPEPVDADKPKLNLKKRPDEQDAKTLETEPQPRDRGRFTRREPGLDHQGEVRKGQFDDQAGVTDAKPVKELPKEAPFRDPPQRMTDAAKADWHATPETVRGDVHRVQNEFVKAYRYYKDTHEAFQPIARFHQMAQQHGTTLEQALTNYTSMEQKLRADVVGGLDVIVNNLNLKAPNGAKLGLRDIAYHVLSQSPEQLHQVQMGNAQQAQTSQIGALHQEVRGLKEQLAQMHTAQQFTYTRSQVDQFADSHPRFDELGTQIEQELKLGFDLETAYRRAELLKPATTAAQTRTTAPQTRAPADRSISGSPGGTPTSALATRAPAKPTGRREAIANAIKRVNGGL